MLSGVGYPSIKQTTYTSREVSLDGQWQYVDDGSAWQSEGMFRKRMKAETMKTENFRFKLSSFIIFDPIDREGLPPGAADSWLRNNAKQARESQR
jgi:hypothetical protein